MSKESYDSYVQFFTRVTIQYRDGYRSSHGPYNIYITCISQVTYEHRTLPLKAHKKLVIMTCECDTALHIVVVPHRAHPAGCSVFQLPVVPHPVLGK